MFLSIILYLVIFIIHKTFPLLCYNGTFTYRRYGEDPLQSRGLFGPSRRTMSRTRCLLTASCSRIENAMCFVRSWSARNRHAWIVQRGCYQPTAQDTLPRSMNTPTRSMTCKHERHADAEYKVCLCQADWCNSASTSVPSVIQYITKLPTYLFDCIVALYKSSCYV